MHNLVNRLSTTFVQDMAILLDLPKKSVRKALRKDIRTGVCAHILAISSQPKVHAIEYAGLAVTIGKHYERSKACGSISSTTDYDDFLLSYTKGTI